MLFRKFLMRIRKEYNTNSKRLFTWSGAGILITGVIGILIDMFLPFDGLWIVLRSLLLIPSALSIFVFAYAIGLILHYRKNETDEEWIPYRMRFSPAWRVRISAMIGAFILVLIYAIGQQPGYTLISSIFVAIVVALFAFMRTTRDESIRQEYAIPDARDTRYSQHKRTVENQREEKREDKKNSKKKKSKKTEDDDELATSEE